MAGISSKAAGTIQNKEKTFQGQRFDDDLGLNWVQFKWRNHDPQIGRFIEVDPLSEEYAYNSTYAFSENHVTSHVELEGLEKVSIKSNVTIPMLPAMPVSTINTISKIWSWLIGVSSGSGSTQPSGNSFTHPLGQGANTKSENPTGPSIKLGNLMDLANGATMVGPLKPKPGESQWLDFLGIVKNVGDEILKVGDAYKKSPEQKTEENTSSTSPNANNNKKDTEKKAINTKITKHSVINHEPDSIFEWKADSNGTQNVITVPNPKKKKND